MNRFQRVMTSPWLLAFACLTMYWAGNGRYSLWDRDEPRFATATREMIARQDWIVPTFNGELRPDKPIFIYWLQRFAYRVFGDGPFAARFWSGVGGTIACLLTWRLGRQMFHPRVGLLAGWILALSPMLIVESKLGTVDAVLLACVIGAMDSLWRITQRPSSHGPAITFWICIGLGILTKGPVVIAVPLATGLAWLVIQRDYAWLRGLRPMFGLAIVASLVLPWLFLVQQATDQEFLRRALGHHVVNRTILPLENHSGFPGYYVVSVFGLMAPWAFLLPWAALRERTRILRDPRLCFLASWSLGTLILFEIVRTKLVHYYLPAYPALAIFLASVLVECFERASSTERRPFEMRLGSSMIALGALFAGIVCVLGTRAVPTTVAWPMALVGAIGGVGLAMAGWFTIAGRPILGLRTQLAAGVLTATTAGLFLLPSIHQTQLIVTVADRLEQRVAAKQPVALWHYRDPSLIYNVGQILPMVDPLRDEPPFDDAYALAKKTHGFLCPVTVDEMDTLSADPRLRLAVREVVRQWDLRSLKTNEVRLVEVMPSKLSQRETRAPR